MPEQDEWAIRAAIAARRPLLVRGEPGTGKTQLAWAAAAMLKRPLLTFTVDSNTESRDLLWEFDAVQRLAEAQVVAKTEKDPNKLRDEIEVKKFLRPGPLWWAFDWDGAQDQFPNEKPPAIMPVDGNWTAADGVVILIDEIDKAESNVPNGLLEALGMREFTPRGFSNAVRQNECNEPPLIVITTNEERALPFAFVRRCLVTELKVPETENAEGFIEFMAARGEAHFGEAAKIMIQTENDEQPADQDNVNSEPIDVPLTRAAAKVLLGDRREAIRKQEFPRPGLAEYLDFVRAIVNFNVDRSPDDHRSPQDVFEQIQSFVFNKASSLDR